MSALAGLRLVSYEPAPGASPRAGVVRREAVHDLGEFLGNGATTVLAALERWDETRDALGQASFDAPGRPLAETRLLAPILYPAGLFCAGANYTDHVAEMAQKLGLPDTPARRPEDKPWHFVATPAHSVVGPDTRVPYPRYATRLDWEAEIGIVIGRAARHVPQERALEHVAGLTIVNDLSARDHVSRPDVPIGSPFHWDWMSQKCFAGAKPMGPWIMPLEAIDDLSDLPIRLWVNDVLRQDSNSRNLIFGFAEQVAYLSTRLTLRPGDVIATGTPAGVGLAQGVFLEPGDEIRIEVAGVGTLRHWIGPPDG